MQDPTPDNVTAEWRYIIYPKVEEWAKQQGAVVSMLGCPTCPWCNQKTMQSKTVGSFIGICSNNSAHVVQWIPWGG